MVKRGRIFITNLRLVDKRIEEDNKAIPVKKSGRLSGARLSAHDVLEKCIGINQELS